MDAHALPDDPRDWPTDPFELLGVPRTVGEADLKRAYTRLIRKYKPEHAPDEFRRIREAYEAAVEISKWFRDAPPVRDTFRDLPFTAPPAPEPAPSEQADVPPEAPRNHDSRETLIDPPVRPAAVDPVEAAWADAVAGEWTRAYAALVALAKRYPHRADLPLRLYWLLGLRPTLDDDRTRHDWLAEALTRARLSGPAVELYRRELAADPQAALYGPYVQLLELPGARGADVLAFATARLAAAAQDGRWAVLELDLADLERRAPAFEEGAWLGYVADLAARAAFDRPPVFHRCRELMTGMKHLGLSHGWAFDQFDEQHLLAERVRADRIVPEPVGRAVAASFQSGGSGQKALDGAIAWAASDPAAALRACDLWIASRNYRDVSALFARLVDARRARGPKSDYPAALVRGAVRAFIVANEFHRGRGDGEWNYAPLRGALVRFLLAERIDPEELTTACLVDLHQDTRALVHRVRGDDALRLVYRLATAPV